jgi:hypothetical protein
MNNDKQEKSAKNRYRMPSRLPIDIGDSKLQGGSEAYPKEVGDVDIGNPAHGWYCVPDSIKCPDESAKHQYDVD